MRSVGEQVGRLVQALEEHGIMEETIVVITSDHGECLGEVDRRGERTMGHFDAMSEHLWTVPLIIANPNIDERTVSDRVSLKSLFDLLTGDLNAVLDAGGRQWVAYFDEDPVLFELPVQPSDESSLRSYEHFPDWFVERVAKTHTVLGFDGKWTVAVDSHGESLEFHDGDPTDESSIPRSLRVACEDAVAAFPPVSGTTENDLPNTVQQQLRDLGYV